MVDYGVMRRSVFRLFFFFSFSEHSVRDFGELLRRAGPSYFSCVILSLWTILFPFFGFLSGWRACMLTIGLYSFPFFFFPFPFFFFLFLCLLSSLVFFFSFVYVISLNLAKRGTLKTFSVFLVQMSLVFDLR